MDSPLTEARMPRKRPLCLVSRENEVFKRTVIAALAPLVVHSPLPWDHGLQKLEAASQQDGLRHLSQKIQGQRFITQRLPRPDKLMLSLTLKVLPLLLLLLPHPQLHILGATVSPILSRAVYTRMILDSPLVSMVRYHFLARVWYSPAARTS